MPIPVAPPPIVDSYASIAKTQPPVNVDSIAKTQPPQLQYERFSEKTVAEIVAAGGTLNAIPTSFKEAPANQLFKEVLVMS